MAVSYWTRLMIRLGLARFLPGVGRRSHGTQDFLHYYCPRILDGPHAEFRSLGDFLELPPEPDRIDLGLGTPLFDLVPSTSTKLPVDRRGYPPVRGLIELRRAVADRFEAENQLPVDAGEEVLITSGAAGALSAVLDAFVSQGDRVVLFDPTSPLFSFALRHRGARPCWLPSWTENGRRRFRKDLLARSLKGARLLLIDVPANPTGATLAPEDVEEIAWWADRHDVLIFWDQSFGRFQYESPVRSIAVHPQGQKRALTAGSVSKGHALASARVGWLAGHRHLIGPAALCAALHTPFVPTLCQQIALTALNQPETLFAPILADFDSRRRYAHERLRALGLEPVWPAGGFFFWVPVQKLGFTGKEFARRLLGEHKVLVWPGEYFGPSGSGFIRLSYAIEDGRLRQGLMRLGVFLQRPAQDDREERPAA